MKTRLWHAHGISPFINENIFRINWLFYVPNTRVKIHIENFIGLSKSCILVIAFQYIFLGNPHTMRLADKHKNLSGTLYEK